VATVYKTQSPELLFITQVAVLERQTHQAPAVWVEVVVLDQHHQMAVTAQTGLVAAVVDQAQLTALIHAQAGTVATAS
jgi:hypothetical protein